MRVLDIQAQQKRAGFIRLGEQQLDKTRPGARLATFRLTSNDKKGLERAAQLYGGEVRKWENGQQSWQLTTKANELPIEVGNVPASTQYELWKQVGGVGSKQCLRRCDSHNITEGLEAPSACKCPRDPIERAAAAKRKGSNVCTLNLRLFVRLPQVPDVGLWQVTTGSYYAAREVPAIMDGIEALASMGAHIPARLAIDVRRSKGKKFPVLAVRLDHSSEGLRELAAGHFEKMRALEGGQDKMMEVAFKLGLPVAVVDGKLVQTVQEAPQLPARQQNDDVIDAEFRDDTQEFWGEQDA